MTEAKALKELQQGSQRALEWFIDKYTPYVSAVVYNIIGSSMSFADMEEVAADAFFALWRNSRKVYPNAIKGYIGSIARNLAKNKLRELGVTLSLDDDIILVDGTTPETQYEKKARDERVRAAVLSMPSPDREIFLRFYYYGQALGDISREMNMKLSTVKSRLLRGRDKLRMALEAEHVY